MMKYIAALLILFSGKLGATTYYFSNAGSNAAGGTTSATAYQTISKLNTLTLGAGDTVKFRRGDTFTGTITQPGNGSSGNPVVYTDYGTGALPIISGFTTLSSWTQVGSTNVWQASVSAGTSLEVVMNGSQFRAMGRTPNAYPYFNIDSYDNCTVDYFNGSPCAINSTSAPSGTQSYIGGQIYIGINPYNYDRNEISAHSGNKLTYITANNNNSTAGDKGVNNKFFVQNHVSTLDQAGEWYYNRSTTTLNYYSVGNPGSIVVAANDYGMYYAGSSGNNKHDITFRNIRFTGQDSIALRFYFADRIVVDNCEFYYTGTNAIEAGFDFGSDANVTNIQITNCTIKLSGNTGIDIRHGSNVKLYSNTIDSCGYLLGMGKSNNLQRCGILVYSSMDSVKIKYNIISNSGYAGILFNGLENTTRVVGNSVTNHGLVTSDAGGIYTCCGVTTSTNRVIDSNIVRNGYGRKQLQSDSTTGGMPGIYADDNSNNLDITNNTVQSNTRAGIYLHNTNVMNVTGNNIYADKGELALSTSDDANGGAVRNTVFSNNNVYTLSSSPIIQLASGLNDYSSQGTFSNNYYSRPSSTTPFQTFGPSSGNYSFASWKSTFSFDVTGSTFTQVNVDSMALFINPFSYSFPSYFIGSTYRDLQGNNYTDNFTLPPYYSRIARKVSYITIIPGTPYDYIINNSARKRKHIIK